MIIKSTNITTSSKSGKIVHHLIGKFDENDRIQTLWGSRADVDDSFVNAELNNRKYGVKHFIISNLEEMTDEQFLQTIDAIGQEFGFNRNKPILFDYLTDEQKNNYKLEYEKDKYAKLLFENQGRAKCLDSIALLKVFERNSELMQWKSRDEVLHAKMALQKLNIVRDINIHSLDQQGQDEFRKAQEALDIEKARKAVLEAHKRKENRYLLDVRPDENEEKIEQNQEKEKSNVVEFPKNNNIKKKKLFSYSR